ncbi:MAG: NfeD family protein [Alphaproteobacteria bacterium]
MIASLIILLHLAGFIDASSAITSLYVTGTILIIAEIGVVSFGLIALNGIIALYAAHTLQSGSDLLFGIPMGWQVLFGIALVEITLIISIVTVYMWIRKQKITGGTESMIGDTATIMEWHDKKGSVLYEGEIWKARAEEPLTLEPKNEVTIKALDKLELIITR